MEEAFEKQIKPIEDQGKKQIDALEQLKPKEQTKPIEDSQKLKSYLMILLTKKSELHDGVDYNNLKFEYVGPTKDVSFYEYEDSKELFN